MVCVAVGTLSTGGRRATPRRQCHPGVVGRSPVMKGPPCESVCGMMIPDNRLSHLSSQSSRSERSCGSVRQLELCRRRRRPASGGASEVDIFWSQRTRSNFHSGTSTQNSARAPARATIVPVSRLEGRDRRVPHIYFLFCCEPSHVHADNRLSDGYILNTHIIYRLCWPCREQGTVPREGRLAAVPAPVDGVRMRRRSGRRCVSDGANRAGGDGAKGGLHRRCGCR